MTTMLVWARVGADGEWNGSPTANPATQVGGISVPYTGLPVYAFGGGMVFEFGDSDKITANFGGSAFVGTMPTGFVAWGAGDTWNPASVASGTQLTNGNLSISNNATFTSFANSIGSNSNTAVYLECTLNHLLETINTSSNVGLQTLSGVQCNAEAQFNVNPNPCSWSINGGSNINFGNSTGVGTVICIAAIIGTPSAPGLPLGLAAIAETTTTIEWQWTAAASGGTPTSYTLQYRVTGTSPWTQITGISPLALTQFTVDLLPGTEYDAQIEAVNAWGNSGFSATANGTTLTTPPPSPIPSSALPQSLQSYRGQVGINFGQFALFGDMFAGVIGKANFDTFTEYGNQMQAMIVSPPIHKDRKRIFVKRFEIDVESGIGLSTGQGSDPQWMLDWSKDGGRTWSPQQVWRSMGRLGEYQRRLRWLRMGQSRQWIFRLRSTDPVRRVIIGFYLDTMEGMG